MCETANILVSIISHLFVHSEYLLWIEIEMSAIDLVESPEQVFRCTIDIIAARVIWKVIAEW